MNLSRNQIIIVGVIGAVVLFFILLFLGLIPGLKPAGSPGLGITAPGGASQTKLSFWGVSEAGGPGAIKQITDEYSKSAGGTQINYTDFPDAASYEKSLLEAFATGRAPDIFMFHSSWLPKNFNKVAPAPDPVNVAYVQQMFPDVVQRDFVYQGRVVALPLYIDTLAFIYNKDIFNAKSIALAPRTWEDFEVLIPQLRELNLMGQITKPAAAIGGSERSVSNASDVLGLLMLQYGSKMVDASGANFGKEGLSAFNFYLQFANPSSAYYTWNDNSGYSIDIFSRGETGAIFNYQSAISKIKEKNPYMNIGVGPMLQFDPNQPVNYSDYWGLAVSYQSSKKADAWNFVLSATADAKVSDIYLQASGKSPALRSLIDKYKNDPNLGVFARQALTAKSWSQPDSAGVKQIFSNMIESVLTGKLSSDKALEQAKNSINTL